MEIVKTESLKLTKKQVLDLFHAINFEIDLPSQRLSVEQVKEILKESMIPFEDFEIKYIQFGRKNDKQYIVRVAKREIELMKELDDLCKKKLLLRRKENR